MSNVSAESLSAVSALIDQLPNGEAVALDSANAGHRAVIEAALEAAGRTAERYPALHGTLDGGGSGGDHLILVDHGRDSAGRATATAWHASGRDHLYSGGTLFALDGDSGALLALGHNANVGDGFVAVGTDTAEAQPAGASLKVLAVHHSVSQGGEARFTALAASSTLRNATLSASMSGDANITVTQPTQTPVVPPNVRIAVARTGNPTDVDYHYNESQNVAGDPYLIVPFLGQATLSYEIEGTAGQPISGAQLQTQLYFVGGGVTYIMPMNPTYTPNFASRVTMDQNDPYTLHWSYPYDAGASYTSTTSIVYAPQSLANEQISYFFYSFQIPVLNGPTPTVAFNVCSTNTPTEPSSQCFNVPNLWFWWHCLAAGTKIALADGNGAAIEEIDTSYRVATGDGGDLAVEATSAGSHKAASDESPHLAVYRLVTDAGHELIGTGPHVVQTPRGLIPLSALCAGDEVATDGGTVQVESCEAIDHDGMFHNLKLGDRGDRDGGLDDDAACTYIANGIVVGDHLAQQKQHRRLTRDIEHMRPLLPDGLEADYESAIADIRY